VVWCLRDIFDMAFHFRRTVPVARCRLLQLLVDEEQKAVAQLFEDEENEEKIASLVVDDEEPQRFADYRRTGDDEDGGEEDKLFWAPIRLSDDIFSVGLSCIVRDLFWLNQEDGSSFTLLRCARLLAVVVILYFSNLVQVWLILVIRDMVVEAAIVDLQEVYSLYESHMYRNHTESWYSGRVLVGIPGHFEQSQFGSLPQDVKDTVCRIPLSSLPVLGPVLFIWALAVTANLRQECESFHFVIMNTKLCDHMGLSLKRLNTSVSVMIAKLPISFKVFYTFFLFLPRVLIALSLLTMGSHWLTATTDFNVILMNSVALGFIIEFGEILYVVVPERLQQETSNTLLKPRMLHQTPSVSAYFVAFTWILVAAFWTCLYIFGIQTVLPGYRWDVTEACRSYLESAILAVKV